MIAGTLVRHRGTGTLFRLRHDLEEPRDTIAILECIPRIRQNGSPFLQQIAVDVKELHRIYELVEEEPCPLSA